MILAVTIYEGAVVFAAGALLGFWLIRFRERSLKAALTLKEQTLLENARREGENIRREASLAASQEALRFRQEGEQQIEARRKDMAATEQRLSEREAILNRQLENLVEEEKNLRAKLDKCQKKSAALNQAQEELAQVLAERRAELSRIARVSETEAKALLLQETEKEALKDANHLSRAIIEDARLRAEEKARQIITTAIQRYAGEHTSDICSATVALPPGDEIKGRIIGREGRNIRAFEAATGVTVLIDDTPNAVVLSGFDPVRREIARDAMERLVADGRIHPTRIDEVVQRVAQEMDETLLRLGEEAVQKAGVPPMHIDVLKLLGKLHFRLSFSQNILKHSVEVAHLAGLMAAELGADVSRAKRVGLLHDIGKAVNHEIEGPHALVGAELLKRYGEPDDIVNGVASHHGEVPAASVLGPLAGAADAISASRPGARIETMTTYIKRVESLEKIALSFEGVEKCFAVHAGRELRVFVHPDRISDDEALKLARQLVRRIEDELQYPGQIRVTVTRETRCIEIAK